MHGDYIQFMCTSNSRWSNGTGPSGQRRINWKSGSFIVTGNIASLTHWTTTFPYAETLNYCRFNCAI